MQLVRDELRNIGNRLTKCRQDLGLSQEEVAEELGVSRNTISSIENGGQEFSVIKLHRFSVLYGVSSDFILTGCKEEQTPDNEFVKMIMKFPSDEQRRWIAMMKAYQGKV